MPQITTCGGLDLSHKTFADPVLPGSASFGWRKKEHSVPKQPTQGFQCLLARREGKNTPRAPLQYEEEPQNNRRKPGRCVDRVQPLVLRAIDVWEGVCMSLMPRQACDIIT